MADTAFKEKITKRKFDAKMVEDFGYDNIYSSPYSENNMDDDGNPVVNKMTLYYTNEHKHLGTWMKGSGWIFKSAYAKLDNQPVVG